MVFELLPQESWVFFLARVVFVLMRVVFSFASECRRCSLE